MAAELVQSKDRSSFQIVELARNEPEEPTASVECRRCGQVHIDVAELQFEVRQPTQERNLVAAIV